MEKENGKIIYNDFNYVIDVVRNLCESNKTLIIAIDGRCGGGKSTLGALLTESFKANIFHMDDFFLPLEMRTHNRLNEAGGNVHYERFEKEILRPLKNNESVVYRKYLCNKWDFSELNKAEQKSINIIEGSYSLHPKLRHYYDYKIFIDIDPNEQQKRILKRNGEQKLQDFLSKWIPMEENYFKDLDIRNQCDIIVNTSIL